MHTHLSSFQIKKWPYLSVLFLCLSLSGKSQIISTVAGTGTSGFNGDSLAATATLLQSPYGIAIDSEGTLYLADQFNQRIRKVTSEGIITTVAGEGTKAYGGDGGPATDASLAGPTNVAFDKSGNVYIADRDNNRIRKVDTSGIISTVAGNGNIGYGGDGGPATSANLASPTGIAVDTSGNLYIADRDNHRIRKVNNSGIISTVAGNGVAGNGDGQGIATDANLYSPTSLAIDSVGNIFIADRDNHLIRKLTPSGNISTVAGDGSYFYNGDGIPAINASLAAPSGVAFDNDGNLLIADSGNFRVRRIDANGIISTVAGNGTYGFSGDGVAATATRLTFVSGVTTDDSGNIYIADTDNHRIRMVSAPPKPIVSVMSGNWDNPTTWEDNRLPVAGDRVELSDGHTVIITGTQASLSLDFHSNAQIIFSGAGSTLVLGH